MASSSRQSTARGEGPPPRPALRRRPPQMAAPANDGPSTSKKHRSFVGEPMDDKLVTDIAGIGATLGDRLRRVGIVKARQLLGIYLIYKDDLDQFKKWMKEKCDANVRQAAECYQCIAEWSAVFHYAPNRNESTSSRQPQRANRKTVGKELFDIEDEDLSESRWDEDGQPFNSTLMWRVHDGSKKITAKLDGDFFVEINAYNAPAIRNLKVAKWKKNASLRIPLHQSDQHWAFIKQIFTESRHKFPQDS